MDEIIHIAACCDDNYAPYAAVMMLSALQANPDTDIHFHLVDCGISEANLAPMYESVQAAGGVLSVYQSDESLYRGLPTHRYGPAVYQRINLPVYMPDAISRVLYIDSDTLVLGDLRTLWQTDLKGQPVAAVENYSPKACTDINIDRKEYFNSGVLLMDLAIWRDESLHTLVSRYAQDHASDLKFVDQCSLNAVLRGRWTRLPARWNQQSDVYKVMTKYAVGCSYSPEELHGAAINPGIVHFIGKKKPWKVHCFHPFKATYRRILSQTHWAGLKPPDDSLYARLNYYTSLPKLWKYHRRKMRITTSISTGSKHGK